MSFTVLTPIFFLEGGLNIDVGLQYLEAWLRGNGCVPIYNLMEDAATAEISRAQVWQWVRHKAKLAGGRPITGDLVVQTIQAELEKLKGTLGAERYQNSKFELAAELFAGHGRPVGTERLVAVVDEHVDPPGLALGQIEPALDRRLVHVVHREGEVPVGLMLAASGGADRRIFELAAGLEGVIRV